MATNFTNDPGRSFEVDKPIVHSGGYRCHIALITEDEGDVSAIVLNLPGVGSGGGSDEEALSNVREAIAATLASYAADKASVPWLEPDGYSIPANARQEWISVDA